MATKKPVGMSVYRGSCHCGAIGFEYTTGTGLDDWSVRACQCRFCRAHDALSASDPGGELRFIADEPQQLQRYRFALGTADFLLCRRCGVYIGAAIEVSGGYRGIINTHALSDSGSDIAAPEPISYDGEDVEGRVARRDERWTPVSAVPW